jgi:hypothetical protein
MADSEPGGTAGVNPEVFLVEPHERAFVGAILRDVLPGAAKALAMFGASATVNRVQSLPGFTGAAFMASAANDVLLELFRWQSAAAFGAVRDDHRYAEHTAIVDDHSTVLHSGFSPVLSVGAPFALSRGEPVAACLSRVADRTAAEVLALLDRTGPAMPGVLRHVVPSQGGATILVLSKAGAPLTHAVPGAESWRGELWVVEAVSAVPRSAGGPVKYRLLPRARDGQAGGSAADHA